jgi:hypothetical protein
VGGDSLFDAIELFFLGLHCFAAHAAGWPAKIKPCAGMRHNANVAAEISGAVGSKAGLASGTIFSVQRERNWCP